MNNQNNLHICTCFDSNFLPRGLALYKSIKQFHNNFVFYVLAFDDTTSDYIKALNYNNIEVITPCSYNEYFNTSPDKYSDRKQYFFSATPNLCLYVLEKHPEIDSVLYLDADVYVFNSLDTLYEEVNGASIAFCSHRFYPLFDLLSKNYGRYNVGVNFFRNTETGLKCLHDWKADCDGWYPDKPGYPLKFFSDQIFLDSWCEKYDEIKIIENRGIDTAPWNIANYKISEHNESYYVGNDPLVIYHFSALKKISDNMWNGNTIFFFGSIRGSLMEVYKKYISEIESFGLNNSKISIITHSNSYLKKIFYFFMKFILNEIIYVCSSKK